ncbi:DNA-processing protein DprA [Candidatus Vampirococcus lugosii]|uniref:DNA recombination-mediator protein A n=1 Tax=Candidatus Vampirococcus lugosii TaxID=2789015 RepID=A0ABS5QM04_9BACT|nr:DNA-processing protein DprA [Candidatus Vampirococcus lugosii]MBS8122231.1 DNA recombination-mediator protein A [Candidatus Vampirococcus lugosii]
MNFDLNYKKALLYSLDEKITLSQLSKLKKEDLLGYNFDKIYDYVNNNNIDLHIKNTDSFHFRLSKIKSTPHIIYSIGNFQLLNKHKIIAIVGPRNLSNYGKKILEELFDKLKGYKNIATISGLASGIDQLCHNLSIENNIPTISVLGGGIGYFLSSSDRNIINKILENNGLILSEFKIKMRPTNYSFPQRNRIIAGISDFVFVPEAGDKSGSLITVDFAKKMNIPVFASPNSIFEKNSKGVNRYISKGFIESIFDIQDFVQDKLGNNEEYINNKENNKNISELNEIEKKIYLSISQENISLKEIIVNSGLSYDEVITNISMLEIKGFIYESNSGYWSIL